MLLRHCKRNELLAQAVSPIPFIDKHITDVRSVGDIGYAVRFRNRAVTCDVLFE